MPDIDAAVSVPLGPRALLTPRAGLSMILGASGDGALWVPGVNFGLGALAPVEKRVAVRVNYGLRIYHGFWEGDALRLSNLLIGIAWLH